LGYNWGYNEQAPKMTTQAQIDAARNRLADWHALYGTIPDEAIAVALTAAAEVGPCELDSLMTTIINVEKETIERCAQVTDALNKTDDPWLNQAAAAIRALKDKP
jgi:hypothetical protein